MKRTIVDQIEVRLTGDINVRMRKQIVDTDSGEVYDVGYAYALVVVGGDCDVVMDKTNDQLISEGFGRISANEITDIKSHAQIAFTPNRIADYQAKIAAVRESKIAALDAVVGE
jgi:hypothetical protein